MEYGHLRKFSIDDYYFLSYNIIDFFQKLVLYTNFHLSLILVFSGGF